MEIITKRFLLREFIEKDEPAFIAYHADRRYAEFCAPEEVTPDHARGLLHLFGQWVAERPRRNHQLAIACIGNATAYIRSATRCIGIVATDIAIVTAYLMNATRYNGIVVADIAIVTLYMTNATRYTGIATSQSSSRGVR